MRSEDAQKHDHVRSEPDGNRPTLGLRRQYANRSAEDQVSLSAKNQAERPVRSPKKISAGDPAISRQKRTRRVVCVITLATLLGAGFGITLISAYLTEQMAGATRVVTMELRGAPLDANETERIFEESTFIENIPSFVLWEERSQEYVENPLLKRGTKVNVVLAEGDVSLIVKGAFLPEAELPSRVEGTDFRASEISTASGEYASPMASAKTQEQFCTIDTSTALELFGDVDVAGMHIRYGNEDFTINKVVESARPFFLIRVTADTGVAFDMLTAHNVSGQSAHALGESLAFGLSLDAQVIDYGLLYHMAHLLSWFPTLLLSAGYLIFLLAQGFVRSNTARRQAIFLLGFLLGAGALIAFVVLNVKIPRELIPSRFSDFMLWQEINDSTGSSLRILFDRPVYTSAAPLMDSFFIVVALSISAIVLYLGTVGLIAQALFSTYTPRHGKLRGWRPACPQSVPRLFRSSLPEQKSFRRVLPCNSESNKARGRQP